MVDNQHIYKWNDEMFEKHPTPYGGIAGIVEKYRINKVINYANLNQEDSVLEIGCEAGNLLLSLPVVNKRVGFDISKKALREAKKNASKKKVNANFVHGDAMKPLPFTKGDFNVIICSETLEHVIDPDKVVDNIYKICDENTKVIITVPNEKPKLAIKSLLTRLGLMKLLFPQIEQDQSEWHLHAFTKRMLKEQVENKFMLNKMGSILGLHNIVLLQKK